MWYFHVLNVWCMYICVYMCSHGEGKGCPLLTFCLETWLFAEPGAD